MSPPKFSTALRHDSVEPLQICRTPHMIPETLHYQKKTQRKSLHQKKIERIVFLAKIIHPQGAILSQMSTGNSSDYMYIFT
jgi:hypothetical protein